MTSDSHFRQKKWKSNITLRLVLSTFMSVTHQGCLGDLALLSRETTLKEFYKQTPVGVQGLKMEKGICT